MQDILVIGYSTRNIVCSAKKAGYNAYAIDAFCDTDLRECAAGSKVFDSANEVDIKTIGREKIIELIDGFNVDFDGIVLGSGFEMMDLSNHSWAVLNNKPQVMQEVSDKEKFAKRLDSLGVPHPHTYSGIEPGSVEYPVMIKPKYAGGGLFNRMAASEEELYLILDELSGLYPPLPAKDMLVQDFVSGTPASVSVLSTGDRALAIAINEQLIGVPWLTELPFAYCGNITPFETPYAKKMCEMAEELVLEFGLVGSNGVDFIVTDSGPAVIEVNARFQGSMDSVELATGFNVFAAHVKAFGDKLPRVQPVVDQFAARAVVYADRDIVINNQMMSGILKEHAVDIPDTGYKAHANEPVTSIIATGKNRHDVLDNVRNSVCQVRKSLEVKHH